MPKFEDNIQEHNILGELNKDIIPLYKLTHKLDYNYDECKIILC